MNTEGLFGNIEVLIGLGTGAFTVVYLYAAQRFLLLSRGRTKDREARLNEAISNGFRSGALESVEDFVNVYKGIHGLGADDVSYRAGLAKVLREYIVAIVSNKSIEAAEAKKFKDFATSVLQKIEAESPFADLPPAERNLLLDVEHFVRANDPASASAKLQNLAGLIEVRQDALERLQSSNKWSMPLAVIGLVLTVIFGIVSLVK